MLLDGVPDVLRGKSIERRCSVRLSQGAMGKRRGVRLSQRAMGKRRGVRLSQAPEVPGAMGNRRGLYFRREKKPISSGLSQLRCSILYCLSSCLRLSTRNKSLLFACVPKCWVERERHYKTTKEP